MPPGNFCKIKPKNTQVTPENTYLHLKIHILFTIFFIFRVWGGRHGTVPLPPYASAVWSHLLFLKLASGRRNPSRVPNAASTRMHSFYGFFLIRRDQIRLEMWTCHLVLDWPLGVFPLGLVKRIRTVNRSRGILVSWMNRISCDLSIRKNARHSEALQIS